MSELDKIKEQEIEISWALHNGEITESEYIEAKNHLNELKTLNNTITKRKMRI